MNKKYIYADNAATTKLDLEAFEAMKPFMLNEYGNPSSVYVFARKPRKAIKDARDIIAGCIGAKSEEIVFTSGGTESDNWAIKGTAFSLKDKGKHIVTSVIEHHAILNSCSLLEKIGYEITYLPVNSEGYVSVVDLEYAIKDDTILVSIMLANNEIGTIQKIAELSEIAHKHGVLFHTDAVQAIGHIPVDVQTLGIDMLSASAHKFNGQKGVGFMYLRTGVDIGKYISGGGQERHLRAGTENVTGIVGMATALNNNIIHLEYNEKHLFELTEYFWKVISKTGLDYKINGSEKRLPGNINLSFKDVEGEMILHRLDLMGIAVSTGSACNSKETLVSHVIQAIGVAEEYAKGTIRISLGKENTKHDIDSIVIALEKILQ